MSFNKEQLEAIAASSNENILISAGAGSGKTKTLSERVFRLISSGEVKPSELLVLTFTNNAAYEMKTRIIQNFKDNGKEDLAKQMVSAHIQTFDSFNQSLLRAYAGRLGIAANIQVADEALIEAKKRNILKDEILSVRYENDKERERLAETIVKFSLTDDRAFMDLVLKLQEAFEKLPSAQEEDIRAHYEERFFSHDAFVSWVYDYFDQARPVIEKAVKEAYFLERHPELEEASAEQLTHVFSNPNNFNLNLGSASFEHPKVQDLASRLIALLSLPKESKKEFFEGLRVIYNDKDAYNKNKGMPRKGYVRKVFEPMSDLFVEKKSSVGAALKNFGIADIEARYQEWMSFAPSILLFLELTKELSDKLMQYKKSNNAYTYQDIARLSLTLLTDPKFAEEAMDIRERFTYIMIDEYQDTNDFQEAFIESLLMPKRDGSMSHVFCVGDAKQSIYRFRNSKVELFRARQKAYLDGSKEGRVIAMNKNYRSGHGLLDDINHIFSYYMNVPHGGIDYHDSMERLSYEEPGAYPAPLSDFGVYRIVSTSRRGHDRFRYRGRLSTKEYCVDWEIQAIIADIKKKMAEGFLVYDRTIEEGDKRRPCRLSDFCVLMRNRTNFPKYLESFEEAGIEVNVSINSALRENEPIILIESLLRLIYRHIDGMSDVKHYFASVARSYVYQYDDEKLDHLIREDDADHTPKYLSDPIMNQIDAFAEAHCESDFNDLFLDLLNEFNVISALPRLGAVAESAAKIESLYARVRLHSSLGGNGMDFLAFLSELNTYQIELEDESLVKVDDAVDIMTIHGSKGLERKIVYFPCSSNSIGMRDRLTEFQLSAKYGLVFPDETYGGIGNALPLNCLGYPLETTMNGKPKREDVDELVRLYYVALTRAENQFIIVGDPSPRRSDNFTYERPYGMLFQLPKYEIFFEDFLKASIDRGFFTQGEVERYKKASKDLLTYLPLERSSFDDETYAFYEMIAEKHWRGHLEGDLQAQYESLCTKALDQYLIAFKEKAEDIDALSAVFGFSEYGLSVHDSHEFTEKIVEAMNAQAKAESDDDDVDETYAVDYAATLENLGRYLRDKYTKAFDARFGKEPKWNDVTEKALIGFAHYYDGVESISFTSFETPDYKDRVQVFDYNSVKTEKSEDTLPDLVLEEKNEPIAFPPVKERKRASKKPVLIDEDDVVGAVLTRGVRLHRYMELIDLKHPDTSFILDARDRAVIDKALTNEVLQNLEGAEVYQEYGYFDELYGTTGFIDCLIIKDGVATIVDYKTRNISEEAYDDQLRTYGRNVMRLFRLDEAHIRLCLLSLLSNETRYVTMA